MRDGNVRNLRDGQLVIKDGAMSPASLTLVLDQGDLEWTEKTTNIVHKDRGQLHSHRTGDDEICDLSFSAKWTQLIGKSWTAGYAIELYEMINNLGDTFTSVAGCGEEFSLLYEFTVSSPCDIVNESTGSGEKIVFAEVFKTSLQMSEGNEMNTIKFTGSDFEVRPTITRV